MYFMNHVKYIICKSLWEEIHVRVVLCVYIHAMYINYTAHHCSPAASEIVMDDVLAALKY